MNYNGKTIKTSQTMVDNWQDQPGKFFLKHLKYQQSSLMCLERKLYSTHTEAEYLGWYVVRLGSLEVNCPIDSGRI